MQSVLLLLIQNPEHSIYTWNSRYFLKGEMPLGFAVEGKSEGPDLMYDFDLNMSSQHSISVSLQHVL